MNKSTSDSTTTIESLKQTYKHFCDERHWEKYDIRDIILSIMIELGEFAEHFQWDGAAGIKTLEGKDMNELRHEFADVFDYLLRLSIELDIDITQTVLEKLELHKKKYPKESFVGDIKKDLKKVYEIRKKVRSSK